MLKKTLPFILFILFVGSCRTQKKIDLPYSGTPPLVQYSKTINTTSTEMQANYDRVMKRFFQLVPNGNIRNEDKKNYYFNLGGSLECDYGASKRTAVYTLQYTGEKDQTTIRIMQICIAGSHIEKTYFKKRVRKKLTSGYISINDTLSNLLTELLKELK